MRFRKDHFTPLSNIYAGIRSKEPIYKKDLRVDDKGKLVRDSQLIAYLYQCFCPVSWLTGGRLVWAMDRPDEHFSTKGNQAKYNGDDITILGVAGREAGSISGDYVRISIHDNKLYAHEIAFAMANGRWKNEDKEIHHINGNPLDNRPWNLEEVSPQENKILRNEGNTKEALAEVLDERVAHPAGLLSGISLKIDIDQIKVADDNGHCPIWRLNGIDTELSKKIAEQNQWHGSKLPAIEVVKDDDGKYFIADGYIRHQAAKILGYNEIEVTEVPKMYGLNAFETAQALSAQHNSRYVSQRNNGLDNALILWKKCCDGLVDIEGTKYRELAKRFKIGNNTVQEIKSVWKWFKTDDSRVKSGNWNIDKKRDEFANMDPHMSVELLEEKMEDAGKLLEKISVSIMRDNSLLAQLLAKNGNVDLLAFADEIIKMEKENPEKLRKDGVGIVDSLDFEE